MDKLLQKRLILSDYISIGIEWEPSQMTIVINSSPGVCIDSTRSDIYMIPQLNTNHSVCFYMINQEHFVSVG